jgi:hypothetical protein
MKNWRTSVFGTGGLAIIAINVLSALLDGNPLTNPDYPTVLAAAMPCIAALFSRDAKVTSEDMGLQ